MGAVRYSVPVGTSFVTAKFFRSSVASDLSNEMTCGGSELVASPFTSWSWRRERGIAFSITPSRVNRKEAVASPFAATVMLRESAVNAPAGATMNNAMQMMTHTNAGCRVRAGNSMVITWRITGTLVPVWFFMI